MTSCIRGKPPIAHKEIKNFWERMNFLLPLLWLAFYFFFFRETPFLLKEQLTGIVVIQLKFQIFFHDCTILLLMMIHFKIVKICVSHHCLSYFSFPRTFLVRSMVVFTNVTFVKTKTNLFLVLYDKLKLNITQSFRNIDSNARYN